MEHYPPYELLPLEDVPLGRLVGLPGHPDTSLAMTVQPIGSDGPPGLVILSGAGRFGILDGAALSRPKVLLYPETRVILPSDPSKLRVHCHTVEAPYGSISFIESQLHLVARLERRPSLDLRRFCSLNDGVTIVNNDTYRTWFTQWSVAIRDSNGVWQSVLDVEAEPPLED